MLFRSVADAVMRQLITPAPPGTSRPVHYEPLPGAAIDAVEAEAAGAWIRERAAGAPIEAAVVGDVTLAQAADWAQRYLGPLPTRARPDAHAPPSPIAATDAGPRSVREELALPAGTAHVVYAFAGPGFDRLYDLRALAAGARVLQTRLEAAFARAGVRTRAVVVDLIPARQHAGSGAVLASARIDGSETDAQWAGAVIRGAVEELLRDGPTPGELAGAAESLAGEIEHRLHDPEY